ncbi:ankyrin repeat-containing domain protein [Lentinula lateritia]|nr:ankyrin repeat-containing domain protein [Lentinula lateritia]
MIADMTCQIKNQESRPQKNESEIGVKTHLQNLAIQLRALSSCKGTETEFTWYLNGLGSEPIVKLLLGKGVDVNAQGGLLLEVGANTDAQGGRYGNALQAASCEKYKPIVKLLLEMGADVNAQGGRYGNALQAASFKGSEPIVKFLLEMGADVNAQGGVYGDALHAALLQRGQVIVRTLLEKGAVYH